MRSVGWLGVWLLAAIALSGCACGSPKDPTPDDDGPDVCSDGDGDGYGVGGACIGEDCDDSNPTVHAEEECLALCADDPHATYCECDPAEFPEPEICYLADQATQGVGPCRAGLRACEDDGRWGPCDGQVLPDDELCDEVDNDCDGVVDDGVLNACGNCDEDCQSDCIGTGCGDGFDIENEGDNVEECEGIPDCITLGGRAISLQVIWIANSSQGTVSKIDTRTREEEGRYITSSYGIGAAASPSRTSVDYVGDVVVANRAFGGQASATRIASEDCPDEDRNGRVDTSSGGGDILDWGDDECVVWNTELGAVGGIARAAAVQDRIGLDGVLEERVWIGLYNERRYHELDRGDGSPTGETAECAPCTPYGAAIDRDGNLWSACLSQNVCRFDTEDTDDVEVLVMPGSNYGITVDEEGRVWTGSTCAMYDPVDEEWTVVAGCRGSGIAADGEGSVWVGQCWSDGGGREGGTCRVDAETLEVTVIPAESYGLGVDFDGFVWAVPYMQPFVNVIDPGDGAGDEEVERLDLGLVGPYTYSDMTGYQLRNATDPQGRYTHVFEGCDSDEEGATDWTEVTYEATTPPGTSIAIAVRTSGTVAGLSAQPWVEIGVAPADRSPLDANAPLAHAGMADGRYLEVQFTLIAESRDEKPLLLSMGAQWSCSMIFQ